MATPVATSDADADAGEQGDAPSQVIVVEPLRIQVVRDQSGAQRVIATDARGIFDEGNDALAQGDFQRALARYDELLADFSDSRLAHPALYNAGLALEGLDKIDLAVQRYLQLASLGKGSRDAIDARIRAASLYAEHQRWNESLAVLDDLLALRKLSESDALEARARRGYVLLEAKDYSAAETTLREALQRHETQSKAGVVFESDYFLAMAHFYLADIPRRQFDAIPIRLPESQMQRDVEVKAGLVQLADARFDEVVRLGNMYWATAAGFRKADMHSSFWREVITAPIPPHLNKQAAALYVEVLHREALGLAQKALSIHGKNLQLAKIYKVDTGWSQASASEVVRLTELIGREQAGDYDRTGELAVLGTGQPPDSAEYMPGRLEL